VISALAERAIASSLAYVEEICNGSRISQMKPNKYPMSYPELPLSLSLSLFLPLFICFFLFFRFCFFSVVRSSRNLIAEEKGVRTVPPFLSRMIVWREADARKSRASLSLFLSLCLS